VSQETVSTMRAVTLHGHGDPEVLRVEHLRIPVPAPGEFRVRVAACAVCGHDALSRAGKLSAAPDAVLGHEISGVIEAVGSEDLEGWVGKRVALTQRRNCGECLDCQHGRDNQCRQGIGFYGDDTPGGYAEFVIADLNNTVEIPDSIPHEIGAVLNCGVGTGYRALKTSECRAGDVVLTTGASGGVGLNAVAVASSQSIRVIAVVSSETKVSAVRDVGADIVLVKPEHAQIREAARSLGRPRGVDAALELTGSPTFSLSYRSLRPGGALVLVGNVTGASDVPMPVGLTILKELRVLGSAHATRQDLIEVVELVEQGSLHIPKPTIFPLEQAAQAHAQLEQRTLQGRAVLIP